MKGDPTIQVSTDAHDRALRLKKSERTSLRDLIDLCLMAWEELLTPEQRFDARRLLASPSSGNARQHDKPAIAKQAATIRPSARRRRGAA